MHVAESRSAEARKQNHSRKFIDSYFPVSCRQPRLRGFQRSQMLSRCCGCHPPAQSPHLFLHEPPHLL